MGKKFYLGITAALFLVAVILAGFLLRDKLFKTASDEGQALTFKSNVPGYLVDTDISQQKRLNALFANQGFWDPGGAKFRQGTNPVDRSFVIKNIDYVITTEDQDYFLTIGKSQLSSLGYDIDFTNQKATFYIQITPEALQAMDQASLVDLVDQRILETVYYSTRYTDWSVPESDDQGYEALQKEIENYVKNNPPLVSFQKHESYGKVDKFLTFISKEVYASHCRSSSYQTGARVTIYSCQGGANDGLSCNPANGNADCPGGTCNSSSQCNFSGTGVCVDQNIAGGGHLCAPGPLSNCTNEDCGSIPPYNPPGPGSTPFCGDGICNNSETSSSCSGDCPVSGPVCGNGICESGESSCPDCGGSCSGSCLTPAPGQNCGDINGSQSVSGSCPAGQLCCGFVGVGIPDCQISNINRPNMQLTVGQAKTLSFDVVFNNGRKGGLVKWTPSISGIVSRNPQQQNICCVASITPVTTITGVAPGTTAIANEVWADGADINLPPTCVASSSVTVSQPNPWWQSSDGDVVAQGSISSNVVSGQYLLENSGGQPGIAVYQGSLSNSPGNLSVTNWRTNTNYQGPVYNYAYFDEIKPDAVDPEILFSTASNGDFASSSKPALGGYYWYRSDGSLAINGDVLIPAGRKVILLVNQGSLYINGKIQLADLDTSFFMVIVGQDSGGGQGNIVVDSAITEVAPTPAIEGLYLADGIFYTTTTGGTDTQLIVRGSVVAQGGFSLGRSLGGGNSTDPAEMFTYSPEVVLNYPAALTPKRVIWREVAP